MAEENWRIHKFGGSSLADASCFRRVAAILAALPPVTIGVVVSAMGGMTERLMQLATSAAGGDDTFRAQLSALCSRYAVTATDLLGGVELVRLLDDWRADANDILDALATVADSGSLP